VSAAAAWPANAVAPRRSLLDLLRPFPSRGLALLIATGFGAASVKEVTPMGPVVIGLSMLVLLGAVRAALVSPRDFPLFLAVYLPYTFAYPMQFATGVNLTNALVVLGVVAWARSRMEPRERVPLGWIDFVVGAYMAVGALGAFHANENAANPFGAALWDLKDWARPFLYYYLVRGLLAERRDVRSFAIVLFYSATLVGVSTWHEGFDKAGGSIDKSRARGPAGQANSNGAFLVYYGAPMLGLFVRPEARGLRRGLALAGFLVTARAMLYTYSRGAYIAVLVSVAGMLLLRSPLHFGAAAALGWGAESAGMMPSSVVKRLGETTKSDVEIYDPSLTANLDKSSRDRLLLWNAARAMIEANPWQGVGLDRFAATVDEYVDEPLPERHPRDAHNAFLLTAAELGLPGLAMMVLNLVSLLTLAVYVYFSHRHPLDRGLALGFVGTMLAVLVSCIFGSRFSDDAVIGYFWMLAALLMVINAQPRDQDREVQA
jgi:O-antigen ligase